MTELSADNALIAAAIEAANPDPSSVVSALTAPGVRSEQAGWSIIAGKQQIQDAIPALWTLLDDDDLCARCACWALGQLDAESFIADRIQDAGIDEREHAYNALAHIAARNAQSANLETLLLRCVDNELERVAAGRTGLGEHACRVLAILGSDKAAEAIKNVTNNDQYSDRFELQRLRKAVDDNGKDTDSIQSLSLSWSEIFADDLAQVAPEEAPADSTAAEAPAPTEADATQEFNDDDIEAVPESDDPAAAEAPAVTPKPIDWAAFLDSAEAAAIDDQGRQVIQQMGPMLEQLALQALAKNLCDLSAQELVVMVLQVLPQAIPPEYMQAALSPPSLNGMQSLARYLARNGLCEHGGDLEEGVRQIRGHIQQQIRASGSLHGSDYDEPDFDGANSDDNT